MDKCIITKETIEDGSQPKLVLEDGEICQMRGKKMYPGSCAVVYFEDETVELKVE